MYRVISVKICVYKHTNILNVQSGEHDGKFLAESYIVPMYVVVLLERETTYLLLYV